LKTTLSPQTLSQADRRLVAFWAAACAERALPIFEAEQPDDPRPRAAIERARAYARGELDTARKIRQRFTNGGAAKAATSPAAAAAARAAGQASVVSHMGAHALGAAAYAIRAVTLAQPANPAAGRAELQWQLAQLTGPMRDALRTLPAVGEDRAGPLGPGLLSTGQLGAIIGQLQRAIRD
jgi:hypothetical protein